MNTHVCPIFFLQLTQVFSNCVIMTYIKRKLEQPINIKSCVKIGKSTSETLPLSKTAYGKLAMKKLFLCLSNGKMFHNNTRSGQQKKQAKVDSVNFGVLRLKIKFAPQSRRTVQQILTEDLIMAKMMQFLAKKSITICTLVTIYLFIRSFFVLENLQ